MNLIIFRHMAKMIAVMLFGLLPLGTAIAASIPALPEILPVTAAAYPDLVSRRAALAIERNLLRDRTRQHNGLCRSVAEGSPEAARCDSAREVLAADIERHIQASKKFIATHMVNSMSLLAKRLEGWSTDEQDRLGVALDKLKSDGDPDVTDADIRQTWLGVLSRDQTQDFAREAAQGDGPGLYGAGEQTRYQDCAVFALANAAGLPYGAVAARATELLREGEWHSAAERAKPQKAIEERGLNGGEVILLAEVFGQVEVVNSKEFAETLKGGRPVMVNVVPASGDVEGAHQVVLTKAFQHHGESWYEMMDSNQGHLRRLHLSARELNVILQENGVAFSPEPDTTPQLLR